ncbi:oxygen-insensitive NADPH nitroreductase [Anaerobacillus alkaliphilus]|uniref:Oxygen-insensitive NADPH nitroreductase n=1 Tax=Anaerobacillus alkaliphilus TaxID=1548597 RepID=A0A4Q0VQ14_9BACI|nr:oxygen-insensitive NADPH nitroreductase [Anaerobacillus alkaliphilus]RXI98191.1 oxygen-insensitive NADPH nitroreductase [Anaerobacillus alkaliphilus]
MNETIKLLQNHASIRAFKDEELTEEQINTIVKSAQMAPTSSFLQAYSIIGIRNQEIKEKLSVLAGNQPYVAKNGHFFVFCADFHRHTLGAELENYNEPLALDSTEKFLIGAVDATLAAQNAVIAAESLGLGTVYIGGIRSNIEEVSELLELPKHVIPIVGVAVGFPDQDPGTKPRLPMENVYHQDQYQQNNEILKIQLTSYNEIISEYYNDRTNGVRKDRWTEQTTRMLTSEKRVTLKNFLAQKGYLLK